MAPAASLPIAMLVWSLSATTVSAPGAQGAPESTRAGIAEVAADSSAPPLGAAPRSAALGDSLFGALTRRFRYQVVAAVYYQGRRYEVADPRILREGFGYRRALSPGRREAAALPSPVPWSEVDSLLLRRSHALSTGFGIAGLLGLLGGIYGYQIGEMAGTGVGPALALLVGGGAAGLGFLAGGFLGGWLQYWQQVYPQVAPEPDWRTIQKARGRR